MPSFAPHRRTPGKAELKFLSTQYPRFSADFSPVEGYISLARAANLVYYAAILRDRAFPIVQSVVMVCTVSPSYCYAIIPALRSGPTLSDLAAHH